MTNLTYGILPSFMWSLIMPIMYLVSVCHHVHCTVDETAVRIVTFCPSLPCADKIFHQHIHTHALQWSRSTGMETKPFGWLKIGLACARSFMSSICFAFYFILAQHWLFLQKPEFLDPRAKYHSLTSGLGTNYTQPRQVGARTFPP